MIIRQLPEGYSEAVYLGHKYGLSKATFNKGRSYKLYAEQLGGNDFISFNYYCTGKQEILKPCEMTTQKVVHFLTNMKRIKHA